MKKEDIYWASVILLIGIAIGALITRASIESRKLSIDEKKEQLDYLRELYLTRDLIESKQALKEIEILIKKEEKEVLINKTK